MANIRYSSEGYDSTEVAFFLQDNEYTNNAINCLTEIKIIELFKKIIADEKMTIDEDLIKFFINKPYNSETYLSEWTIISFKNILERYKMAKKDNIYVFDLGFRYIGMGHVKVIFYDPITQKYYFRSDGGSNLYERSNNFKKICLYNSDANDKKYSFTFQELMQQIHCEIEEKPAIF